MASVSRSRPCMPAFWRADRHLSLRHTTRIRRLPKAHASRASEAVPAAQVMQIARPLPKPSVDKGKVWTVFIGGAAMLFLGTLAIENTPAFFPAIAKANQASADARKAAMAAGEQVLEAETATTAAALEAAELERQTALVEQALAEARARRSLGEAAAPGPGDPADEPQETAAAPASRATTVGGVDVAGEGKDASGEEGKKSRLSSFVSAMSSDGRQALDVSRSPSAARR